MITLRSFGFKNENPRTYSEDVVDCRQMPNPHSYSMLRDLDGRDEKVRTFLKVSQDFEAAVEQAYQRAVHHHLLDRNETIHVGCYGGKHRSVAVVEEAALRLEQEGIGTIKKHTNLPPLP